MDEYVVTLADLAQELGLDRSNMRKYAIKHGFTLLSIRTKQSGNQLTLALSREDADAIRALRESQGFSPNDGAVVENGAGFFYVIKLAPDLSAKRIKLGFANNVQDRLAAHQCAAPTAILLQAWPCRRSWEVCAIASLTRVDCRLIANEVYDCGDVMELVRRGDEFFAIMPPCDGNDQMEET